MTNLRELARDSGAAKIAVTCAQCGVSYCKRADRVRSPDFCCLECRKAFSMAQRAAERTRQCAVCGNSFIARPRQLRMGQGRFCSNACSMKVSMASTRLPEARRKSVETWRRNGNTVPSGPDNPLFMGRKIVDGYVWVWIDGRGYIQEHRLVMERVLGRPLLPTEIVHHINRDRSDNRPDNLELMTRAAHSAEHLVERVEARKLVKLTKGRKLTIDIVHALKADIQSGISASNLARKYGITLTMVGYIKSGKSWAHVA